MKMKLKI